MICLGWQRYQYLCLCIFEIFLVETKFEPFQNKKIENLYVKKPYSVRRSKYTWTNLIESNIELVMNLIRSI